LSTEELVRLDHPEGDEPDLFAAEMWSLHEDFGLRILGGCCGTDDRQFRALPPAWSQAEPPNAAVDTLVRVRWVSSFSITG
jgi:homocysteine S-methyltransferase